MFTFFLILAAVQSAETSTAQPIVVPAAIVKLIEQVDVPARDSGVLEDVAVRAGQLVQAGETLARMIDVDARIGEERARLELELARKNLANDVNLRFASKSQEVARAELQRSLDSNKKYARSISDSEIDRLQLIVERATLEVEQAEFQLNVAQSTVQIRENELEAARERLGRRQIQSPIDGMVVDVMRHRGEWVEPGDAVLRILRLDRVRVEGFVAAAEVRPDLVGTPVTLQVDLPGREISEFSGKVVFVSPELDPVNAQVRVWAEAENTQLQLQSGMRVRMTIQPAP